jgi:hypothetical protein
MNRLRTSIFVLGLLVACSGTGGDGADANDNANAPTDAVVGLALNWVGPTYTLTADDFVITANGVDFTAEVPAASMNVGGDPGNPTYSSIEATWTEHGVEMRLYIYLHNDGQQWWSDEIRTYDGRADGDWITYTGDFFRSPLGTPFVGDLDLTSDSGQTYAGRLRFENLRMSTFEPPSECGGAGAYVLTKPFRRVDLSLGPAFFRGYVELRDQPTCTVVADQADFAYAWIIDDTSVASLLTSTECTSGVDAPCPEAIFELHSLAVGTTVLRAAVTRVSTGDPYRHDQLGGLGLTLEGLRRRDRMVFEGVRERGVAVAALLAGGYARWPEDTVRIHAATIEELMRLRP